MVDPSFEPSLALHSIAMHTPNPQQISKKQPHLLQPNFVHVAGQYRVGKLLSSGGSGEPTLTQKCFFF
jgi:hypothetical protein